MEDWTEKYRPKRLDEIVGNERAVSALRSWARQWNSGKTPQKKAVILSGKAGIGKTSSALALANDLGWIPIELNASDARNAATIKAVATSGAVNETFDSHGRFLSSSKGGKKLIIIDEADNLYERVEKTNSVSDFSDKGGKKAIIETIKKTQQPIILIVNDYYSLVKGSGEQLKQNCTVITYYEVNANQIADLLKRICREESISADVKLLRTIADRCKGDVRSAVNDLQSLSLNRQQVDVGSLSVLGYRDRERIIFDALRDVFKMKNIKDIRESVAHIDVPPETFLLWLTENLPREYQALDDLLHGYDAVSKADVFFGRVYRRSYYGLWSYASDIMSGGIATAKTHNYPNTRYSPPTWIREMGQSKSLRGMRDTVVKKISKLSHHSHKKSKELFLPTFQQLFRNDIRFAVKMKHRLDLSDGEILYLLGPEHKQKLKDILHYSEKDDEKQVEIEVTIADTKKPKKEHDQEIKQPSLLDF